MTVNKIDDLCNTRDPLVAPTTASLSGCVSWESAGLPLLELMQVSKLDALSARAPRSLEGCLVDKPARARSINGSLPANGSQVSIDQRLNRDGI